MSVQYRCAGIQHPQVRQIRSILKNRCTHLERFVAVGLQAHSVIITKRKQIDTLLYCLDRYFGKEQDNPVGELSRLASEVFLVSENTMRRIVPAGDSAAFVSVCPINNVREYEIKPAKHSIVIILDSIRMVGNVGCLIRSANAAAADFVAFTNRLVRLSNPRLVTSSCGAILDTPILESSAEKLGVLLNDMKYQILLADANDGVPYDEIHYPNRAAIVLGSEHSGIGKEWYKYSHIGITVPMCGVADSLNVAAAGSIIMFAASRQLGLVK